MPKGGAKPKQYVWQMYDLLRGEMDQSQILLQLTTLIFIRYLTEKSQAKSINIPKGCSFDDLSKLKGETNIGDGINDIVHQIAQANSLQGVIDVADFSSKGLGNRPNGHQSYLSSLLELLETKELASLDLTLVFEILIETFSNQTGRGSGSFYTPSSVALLLAKLLQPKSGDSIYDPACGSGTLLVAVGKEEKSKSVQIYGQELNPAMSAISQMNLFIHGFDKTFINCGDSIRNPQFLEGGSLEKFDVIASSPPFSVRNWGFEELENDQYNRFWRGLPPKTKGDYAFICHIVESLKKDGRSCVIVTMGALFRGGSEQAIRKALIEEGIIESVIALPGNMLQGTVIPICVIVINKNNSDPKKILFINATEEYEDTFDHFKTFSIKNIDKIANIYKSRTENKGFSKLVPIGEIAENDYNLNITQYINPRLDAYTNLLSRKNQKLCTIKEISTNISTYKENETYSENSVFIPRFATATVYSSIQEIKKRHRKNYLVIQLKEGHNKKFVTDFLNSAAGKNLRDIQATGVIRSHNLKSIANMMIYAPSSSIQQSILESTSYIKLLKTTFSALSDELYNKQYTKEELVNVVKKSIANHPVEFLSEALPFPLAAIIARAHNETDPFKKHKLYLNYFEALSIFISTVQLSGLKNAPEEVFGEAKRIINDEHPFKELLAKATFGNWTTISFNLGKLIRKTQDLNNAFNLSDDFLNDLCSKKLLRSIEEALTIRNKRSHTGMHSDDFYSSENTTLENLAIETGDHLLRMFSNTRMVYAKPKSTQIKDDAYISESYLLMGSNQNYKTIECVTQRGLVDENIYLQQSETNTPLRLLPFIRMGSSLKAEKNAAYFYNSTKKTSVKYVSFTDTNNGEKELEDTDIQNVIDSFSISNTQPKK